VLHKKIIHKIAVIGTGLMGCGIAQVFAGSEDLEVNTFDSVLPKESVKEKIKSNLTQLKEKKIIKSKDINDILSRVITQDKIEDAVKDADFVIECIPENMELKQNIFRYMESLCSDDAIFATNTSVMSITEISARIEKKDRLVGTHFWNPPYLIPLVEVVKSNYTSDEVVNTTFDLLKKVNKRPVKVNKDVPGFLANRLQHALWREAISIVEHGIADAATVDEAIKLSFGLRLPQLAPMENADMVGLDLTLSIHSYILKHLENSPEPSPLLKEKVSNGHLGFKSGKGFRDWTAEQIEESNKNLREYLIKVIYNK
jgi:3-hydroxybutyryl-CoA dehydrogenase